MRKLIYKILNESDFDWIKEVEPYVSFEDVVVGEEYTAILDPHLFEIMYNYCGSPSWSVTYNTAYVVMKSVGYLYLQAIYCNDNNEKELCVELAFYDTHDVLIDTCWVDRSMCKLQYTVNPNPSKGVGAPFRIGE